MARAVCMWSLAAISCSGQGSGGITQIVASLPGCKASPSAHCLRLRGGADSDDSAERERHEAALDSFRRWSCGAEQWAEMGYYQESYWGGPCPEEGCRCRDPQAEPPTIPLPQSVHPSILHNINCICPACQGRRERMQQLAAEQAVEEAKEAERAAAAYDEMQKVMRQGEDGSVYSLHEAYDTDTVPDAIMGSADDPLSPLGVCARHPPRAADAFEELLQTEIAARDLNDPSNVALLIQYAQFLYDTRGDRAKAALLADKVRQLDPGHWWINVYGDKYLAALSQTSAEIDGGGVWANLPAAGAQGGTAAEGGLRGAVEAKCAGSSGWDGNGQGADFELGEDARASLGSSGA